MVTTRSRSSRQTHTDATKENIHTTTIAAQAKSQPKKTRSSTSRSQNHTRNSVKKASPKNILVRITLPSDLNEVDLPTHHRRKPAHPRKQRKTTSKPRPSPRSNKAGTRSKTTSRRPRKASPCTDASNAPLVAPQPSVPNPLNDKFLGLIDELEHINDLISLQFNQASDIINQLDPINEVELKRRQSFADAAFTIFGEEVWDASKRTLDEVYADDEEGMLGSGSDSAVPPSDRPTKRRRIAAKPQLRARPAPNPNRRVTRSMAAAVTQAAVNPPEPTSAVQRPVKPLPARGARRGHAKQAMVEVETPAAPPRYSLRSHDKKTRTPPTPYTKPVRTSKRKANKTVEVRAPSPEVEQPSPAGPMTRSRSAQQKKVNTVQTITTPKQSPPKRSKRKRTETDEGTTPSTKTQVTPVRHSKRLRHEPPEFVPDFSAKTPSPRRSRRTTQAHAPAVQEVPPPTEPAPAVPAQKKSTRSSTKRAAAAKEVPPPIEPAPIVPPAPKKSTRASKKRAAVDAEVQESSEATSSTVPASSTEPTTSTALTSPTEPVASTSSLEKTTHEGERHVVFADELEVSPASAPLISPLDSPPAKNTRSSKKRAAVDDDIEEAHAPAKRAKSKMSAKAKGKQVARDEVVEVEGEIARLKRLLEEREEVLKQQEAALLADEAALKERRAQQTDLESHLAFRETTQVERAHVLTAQERELEERENEIEEREVLAQTLLPPKPTQVEQAEKIVERLEGELHCGICHLVMACPYILTPRLCGHTFCALCLLKFLLGRLHNCGAWHEVQKCPMCRAEMVLPPEAPPRPLESCPFTANRVCDSWIKSRLKEVGDLLHEAATTDAILRSKASKENWKLKQRPKSPPRGKNIVTLVDDDEWDGFGVWRYGGPEQKDLEWRDLLGRTHITRLVNEWGTMEPIELMRMYKLVKDGLLVPPPRRPRPTEFIRESSSDVE